MRQTAVCLVYHQSKCPFKMFRNPKDEEKQLSSVADPQNKQRMAKN